MSCRFRIAWASLLICSISFGCLGPASAGDSLFRPMSAGKDELVAKKYMVSARPGYVWGVNEIRLRDGDNAGIAPGKREVSLESLTIAAEIETFRSSDLAIRLQASLNFPQRHRNWLALPVSRAWDTRSSVVKIDLSLDYYLDVGVMPYWAALVGGYRYYRFSYDSVPSVNTADTVTDRIDVHVPYVGVHYRDSGFVGSLLTLDISASPIVLSRLYSNQQTGGVKTDVDGHSVTGLWFDSFFSWSWPLGRQVVAGVFLDYNFIELSGGATVSSGARSTRFSLDSRFHSVMCGLNAAYSF